MTRLSMIGTQLRAGETQAVRTDLAGWAWSQREAVGMRREFDLDCPPPGTSTVPLTAMLVDDDLAKRVFDLTGLEDRDRQYLERRKAIWDAGITGAYAAVDDHGDPAYLQWLIPNSERAKVASYWGPLFPRFGPDTLLVEGAWIPPKFRGQKVMGDGLYLVTEAARAAAPDDVKYAMCYPEADNRGAVLGSRQAGYEVTQRRIERWRFGRRRVTFEEASEASFQVFKRPPAVR